MSECKKKRRVNGSVKRARNGAKAGAAVRPALDSLSPTDMGRPMFRQVQDAREVLRVSRYGSRSVARRLAVQRPDTDRV